MARTIMLRYSASCLECHANLPVGSEARWYGKGRVYCAGAHRGTAQQAVDALNTEAKRELTFKERFGRCEDAPCCGCCGVDAYGTDHDAPWYPENENY